MDLIVIDCHRARAAFSEVVSSIDLHGGLEFRGPFYPSDPECREECGQDRAAPASPDPCRVAARGHWFHGPELGDNESNKAEAKGGYEGPVQPVEPTVEEQSTHGSLDLLLNDFHGDPD